MDSLWGRSEFAFGPGYLRFNTAGEENQRKKEGYDIVVGRNYTIVKQNTLDFTTVGAPDNNTDTVFTATSADTLESGDEVILSGIINPNAVDLGYTDFIKAKPMIGKIDLKSSQTGDGAADKAVSTQGMSIEAGLAQATVERMEATVQGFHVERDSANRIVQLHGSSVIGQLDSSIAKQLTFYEIVDGIKSVKPFHIMDMWKSAPSSEEAEQSYDSSGQRFYPIKFAAYISESHKDETGRDTYWGSRIKTVFT